jgi:hypothetical protein
MIAQLPLSDKKRIEEAHALKSSGPVRTIGFAGIERLRAFGGPALARRNRRRPERR